MRVYGPDSNYLNKIFNNLKGKYIMFDIINSNQYLKIEIILDNNGGVFLI